MKFLSLTMIAAFGLLAGCVSSPVNSPVAEKIDLTRYRAVNVATVRFVPEVDGALSVEERDSLEREFRIALMEGLPASSLAAEPTPGVVRIEVLVTELNASSRLARQRHDVGLSHFHASASTRHSGATP